MTSRRSLFSSILLVFLLLPGISCSTELPREKIKNGGYIVAREGHIIERHRADELFIPASTIKLLTALAVLDTLGADYRFTTSFFLDSDQVLYIRGGGDPTLTTESLVIAARELKNRGVTRISGYVLDDSAFQLRQPLPDGAENSTNPYDVPNGALAVNFNSIAIRKMQDGTVTSAEQQTPLTPLAREIGSKLAPGKHRVNIHAFRQQKTTPLSLRYSAELIHALLTGEGIRSSLNIGQGIFPKKAKPLYQHVSVQPLREIIRSCMHISNNFIANQLVLTAGAVRYGYPATWGKARRLLTYYAIEKIGIATTDLRVVEGSGLSRQTRVTPAAMLKILTAFEPYRELLPEKRGAHLKSGTMEAVYCYAGYMDSSAGRIVFALLLNQQENTRNVWLTDLRRRFLPRLSKTHTSSPLLRK